MQKFEEEVAQPVTFSCLYVNAELLGRHNSGECCMLCDIIFDV